MVAALDSPPDGGRIVIARGRRGLSKWLDSESEKPDQNMGQRNDRSEDAKDQQREAIGGAKAAKSDPKREDDDEGDGHASFDDEPGLFWIVQDAGLAARLEGQGFVNFSFPIPLGHGIHQSLAASPDVPACDSRRHKNIGRNRMGAGVRVVSAVRVVWPFEPSIGG
jgi:hypothetical protein